MPSKMRFHDLRHSCAVLLHANVAAFMDVREWLDHSDIGTHLDYNSKKEQRNPESLGKAGLSGQLGPPREPRKRILRGKEEQRNELEMTFDTKH